MKAIPGILALFVTMPIWYFLLYRVLEAVQASELMWFLYWIYLPVGFMSQAILEILKNERPNKI